MNRKRKLNILTGKIVSSCLSRFFNFFTYHSSSDTLFYIKKTLFIFRACYFYYKGKSDQTEGLTPRARLWLGLGEGKTLPCQVGFTSVPRYPQIPWCYGYLGYCLPWLADMPNV